MPPVPPLLPPLLPRLLLYNHSGQLRREIQPIQIQPTPIIHHNPLYAIFSLVLLNLFFLFQQCFVSRRAVVVGRVGTRALRWALRRPARCSAPPADPIFDPRIIYDDNESINNSRNHKNTPGAGAQPPRAKPEEAWLAAQRP
jgi:hypothetical protein